MNSPINARSPFISPSKQAIGHYLGPVSSTGRHMLFHKLRNLTYGGLILHENGQRWQFGNMGSQDIHHLYVHSPQFYTNVVLGGSLGAAESYILGEWSTDDLTGVLRLFLQNVAVLQRLDSGFGKILVPLHKIYHGLRINTLRGSQLNIAAHYDFGNDFFASFLDSSMMYSCAYFEQDDATLKEASYSKIDRICKKLKLHPSDHLLEIGSGWGAFAVYAAQNYGCSVTTTTLSREQYRMTDEQIKKAGLEDRVTVLMKDYRKLTGEFDKLVSIEMIEAVGWQQYPNFFSKCSSLLKPDGRMLIQSIVIQDQQYEFSKRHVDFIKRYIFPGGCLPSISILSKSAAVYTDLRLTNLEDMTRHYVMTLAEWLKRFIQAYDSYRSCGYNEAMIRMWEYYFCYSSAGFSEGRAGAVQLVFEKPDPKPPTVTQVSASSG